MEDKKLTPPPGVDSDRFADWLFKLREKVNDLVAGAAAPVTTNDLSTSQKADLTDGGSSSLHYHATDRDRVNHTGTQTADTISDLEQFVQSRINAAATSGSTDYLGCQVFGP